MSWAFPTATAQALTAWNMVYFHTHTHGLHHRRRWIDCPWHRWVSQWVNHPILDKQMSNNVTVHLTSTMIHWQTFTMNGFKWEMVVCQIPAEVDVDRCNDCDVLANQSRRSKLSRLHRWSVNSYRGLPKKPCIMWWYMGATWQIWLNNPCSAAKWAVAIITVAACYYHYHLYIIYRNPIQTLVTEYCSLTSLSFYCVRQHLGSYDWFGEQGHRRSANKMHCHKWPHLHISF